MSDLMPSVTSDHFFAIQARNLHVINNHFHFKCPTCMQNTERRVCIFHKQCINVLRYSNFKTTLPFLSASIYINLANFKTHGMTLYLTFQFIQMTCKVITQICMEFCFCIFLKSNGTHHLSRCKRCHDVIVSYVNMPQPFTYK